MAYLLWREGSEGLVGWPDRPAMATKQSQPAKEGEQLYSNMILDYCDLCWGGTGWEGGSKINKNTK